MGRIVKIKNKNLTVDTLLRPKLDNVKLLMKKKWDVLFLIDGKEGSGKSTLSFICGWYISEGNLTMDNVCEGTKDAVKKLERLPDKSVLIIDEGSLMFSSKEVMRKEQQQLIKILNVIRQKLMCLIVVAPSFFDLNKYISVDRSRFLLHVYTGRKMERGRFSFFGEKRKRILYGLGKKNYNSYSKPKSNFCGTFSKFDPFGKKYQELKRRSLMEAFHERKADEKIPREYVKRIKVPLIYNAMRMLKKKSITQQKEVAEIFEINTRTIWEWMKLYKKVK